MTHIIALAILTASLQAPPQPPCTTRVSGTFKSHMLQKDKCDTQNPCTKGMLAGDLAGEYTFTMKEELAPKLKDFSPDETRAIASIVFYVGKSDVTLEKGNVELSGVDTGALDFARGTLMSLITWTGGKGAMQNATGQIQVRGQMNPKEGTFEGDYVGTLCGG